MQLNHYSSKFIKQKFPITLIAHNIILAANIGSLFRIADAFGVEELVFCGDNFKLGRKYKQTSRATEQVANYRISNNVVFELQNYKALNYIIIGLEITTNSKPLQNIVTTNKPVALLIGNENFGLDTTTLNLCNAIYHINMYGQNSSMNVTQATSIALYELTNKLTKLLYIENT